MLVCVRFFVSIIIAKNFLIEKPTYTSHEIPALLKFYFSGRVNCALGCQKRFPETVCFFSKLSFLYNAFLLSFFVICLLVLCNNVFSVKCREALIRFFIIDASEYTRTFRICWCNWCMPQNIFHYCETKEKILKLSSGLTIFKTIFSLQYNGLL